MAEFYFRFAKCIDSSFPIPTMAGLLLLLISGVFLLSRTLAHMVHSRLGTRQDKCQRRTDTRAQLVFDISRPHPVVFDFSRRDSHAFEVVTPINSRWSPIPTFHLQQTSCITLFTLSGVSSIYNGNIVRGSGSTIALPGFRVVQPPCNYLIWYNYGQNTPASVGVRANVQLYRTLCSAAEDAEHYFRLCSTPVWIRALYAVLGWVPYYGELARRAMVALALYIQLRVIFCKNDCWTYQGKVWINWYWWTTPDWVRYFEAWTTVVISQATLGFLYWLGRLCLGMKESYDEYNVAGESFVTATGGQDMEKTTAVDDETSVVGVE